jgi:Na+-driven multidrug efflux pump
LGRVKRAAVCLGLAGILASLWAVAGILHAGMGIRGACLASAAALFVMWLLMIVSLARHNTSM